MKTRIKQILILLCITFFIVNTVNGQVKNDKKYTNTSLKNKRISQEKLNLKKQQFNLTTAKGGYVIFESVLYKAHLNNKLANLRYKKKKVLSSSTSKKTSKRTTQSMNKMNLEIANTDKEIKRQKNNDYSIYQTTGDCGGIISDEDCQKIKDGFNARMYSEIGDLEDIRPCPEEDEHCFPIPFRRDIKYFLLPRKITSFKGVFFDKRGKKIGTIGKPTVIKGVANYLAYPIFLKKIKGDIFMKVKKSVMNRSSTYTVALRIN